MPVYSQRGRRAWGSCAWTRPAGSSASWKSRRPTGELAHVRTDPAWIDAHGIPSRGRDCLANMGIYLFNRDTLVEVLRKDRLPGLRPGDLSGLDPQPARPRPPLRRLLGGHRHDQVVLRGQPEPGLQGAAVRAGARPTPRSTPGPASCPPRGSTGPRSAGAWWPTAASSARGR